MRRSRIHAVRADTGMHSAQQRVQPGRCRSTRLNGARQQRWFADELGTRPADSSRRRDRQIHRTREERCGSAGGLDLHGRRRGFLATDLVTQGARDDPGEPAAPGAWCRKTARAPRDPAMPPTPRGPIRSRTSRRAPTTPGRLGWSSSGSTINARWWTRSSSRVSSRSNIASTTTSVWWAAIPTVPSVVAAGVDLLVARQAAPKAAVASRSPMRVLVVPSVTAARPVSAPRPASARSAWWAVTARVLEDLRRPGRAGPRVCRSENLMRGHVLVLLAGRGLTPS